MSKLQGYCCMFGYSVHLIQKQDKQRASWIRCFVCSQTKQFTDRFLNLSPRNRNVLSTTDTVFFSKSSFAIAVWKQNWLNSTYFSIKRYIWPLESILSMSFKSNPGRAAISHYLARTCISWGGTNGKGGMEKGRLLQLSSGFSVTAQQWTADSDSLRNPSLIGTGL